MKKIKGLSIRPLTESDREALLEFYSGFTGEAARWTLAPYPAELVNVWVDNFHDLLQLGVLHGDRVVGFVQIEIRRAPIWKGRAYMNIHLADGYMDPELAADMLGRLAAETEASGVHRLEASVAADDAFRMGVYKRLGLRVEGRLRDAIWTGESHRDGVWLGKLVGSDASAPPEPISDDCLQVRAFGGTHPGTVELRDGRRLEVRAAREGDAEPLFAMFDTMSPEALRWSGVPYTRESVSRMLQPTESKIAYVAEMDERVVGWTCLTKARHRLRSGSSGLNIYLHQDVHGVGLGTHLMDLLLGEAKRSGLHRVSLIVAAGNKVAIRLFRRFGFKIEAQLRDAYFGSDGKRHDLLEMGLIIQDGF